MSFVVDETAVVIAAPAAEPTVATWRRLFDSSAPYGVPAHVTIVYPFVLWTALSAADLADLALIFAARRRFTADFCTVGRFPGVLYLEPTPAEPFKELTAALTVRWPQAPPYGGLHPEPIPHLTVTDQADESQMAQIDEQLLPQLPIHARISGGCLLRFDGSRWRQQLELPFGPV